MGRLVAPRVGFDEKRNTSRVFAVPPQAIEDARKAAEWYTRRRPPWFEWVLARHEGRHVHGGMTRNDGSLAACPVYGCAWEPNAATLQAR